MQPVINGDYLLCLINPESTNVRRIFALLLFLPFYFDSFANGDLPVVPGPYFNQITIWLSFFFGLLFTILFRFINKYSKTIDQRSDAGLPLSGWIMFLGINLIVRIILQLYFFWNASYFLKSAWILAGQHGGLKFHMLFIFEMLLSLFALTGTGALIYWFFGRRDIFPAMFIYYVAFYFIATIVLLILYHNMAIPVDMKSIQQYTILRIFRMIYAAAWGVYVWKSDLVKKTFVYPPN